MRLFLCNSTYLPLTHVHTNSVSPFAFVLSNCVLTLSLSLSLSLFTLFLPNFEMFSKATKLRESSFFAVLIAQFRARFNHDFLIGKSKQLLLPYTNTHSLSLFLVSFSYAKTVLPDWVIFFILGNKFAYKSCPKRIGDFWANLKNINLCIDCCWYYLVNFWKHWATLLL